MNDTQPTAVIAPPDLSSGLSALRNAPSADNAFDPISAIYDGAAAGNAVVKVFLAVLFWGVRGIVLPFELLLRRRIGERYVNLFVVGACGAVLWLFRYGRVQDNVTPITVGAVVVVGLIVHGKFRFAAQKKGIHWHSYSEGDSWLHIPYLQERWNAAHGPFTTVNVAKNFLEPLVPLILGIAFVPSWFYHQWRNDLNIFWWTPRPVYFAIAAVVMAGYQYYCSRVLRRQLLDRLDHQLMLDAHMESLRPDQEPGIKPYRGTAYVHIATLANQWKT